MVPTVDHRLFGHPQDVYERLIKGTQYREGIDVPWHVKISKVFRRIGPNESVMITTEKEENIPDQLFEKFEDFTRTGTYAAEFFHQCIHPGNQKYSEPDQNYYTHYTWLARDPTLATGYRKDLDWFRQTTWEHKGKKYTKHQYVGPVAADGTQTYAPGGPFDRPSLYTPESTIRQVQVVFLENTPLAASAGRKTHLGGAFAQGPQASAGLLPLPAGGRHDLRKECQQRHSVLPTMHTARTKRPYTPRYCRYPRSQEVDVPWSKSPSMVGQDHDGQRSRRLLWRSHGKVRVGQRPATRGDLDLRVEVFPDCDRSETQQPSQHTGASPRVYSR